MQTSFEKDAQLGLRAESSPEFAPHTAIGTDAATQELDEFTNLPTDSLAVIAGPNRRRSCGDWLA